VALSLFILGDETNDSQEAKRGTVATNVNQGALSKELEKQKRDQNTKTAPPERVIVCTMLFISILDDPDYALQWD
jgi:hypothetical protein